MRHKTGCFCFTSCPSFMNLTEFFGLRRLDGPGVTQKPRGRNPKSLIDLSWGDFSLSQRKSLVMKGLCLDGDLSPG